MALSNPWWLRIGWPLIGVALSTATYSAIFYADAKTVPAYAKPGGKAVNAINLKITDVHKKITLTQEQLQQLALQYQSLLGTARQDEAIINQVNSQLSAAGLQVVPNLPTSFPIVNGYATNSPAPVFQSMTGAS